MSTIQDIVSGMTPKIGGSTERREYLFVDPLTRRQFEIRQCEVYDTQTSQPRTRFFMSEYEPNGRLCEFDGDKLVNAWDEPLVNELEQLEGPNGLYAALERAGVPTEKLVLMGGGFCLGAIYHDTLEDCAAAIATALADNVRYKYFEPLDEQAKVRQAHLENLDEHAYWSEQLRLQELAQQQEQGLFKGCRSMRSPLSKQCKDDILGYLNRPTLSKWNRIRGYTVTGSGTLWQAWCSFDDTAPRSGSKGSPSPEVLVQSIRHAVEKTQQHIAERLAQSAPRGLRLVQG